MMLMALRFTYFWVISDLLAALICVVFVALLTCISLIVLAIRRYGNHNDDESDNKEFVSLTLLCPLWH